MHPRDGYSTPRSSFHDEPLLLQGIANTIAQIALQFHPVLGRRAAAAAGALQILRQRLKERGVARQAVHDRDRLAAASLLLHAQLGHDTRRNRLVARVLAAALAVAVGPAAARAHAAGAGRVDGPAVAVGHAVQRVTTTRSLV